MYFGLALTVLADWPGIIIIVLLRSAKNEVKPQAMYYYTVVHALERQINKRQKFLTASFFCGFQWVVLRSDPHKPGNRTLSDLI